MTAAVHGEGEKERNNDGKCRRGKRKRKMPLVEREGYSACRGIKRGGGEPAHVTQRGKSQGLDGRVIWMRERKRTG